MKASIILSLGLLLGAVTPAAAQDEANIRVELTPGDADGDGLIDRMAVRLRIDQAPETFRLATQANNVVTSAPDVSDLEFARDGHTFSAEVRDEQEDDANSARYWSVPSGPGALTVSYAFTIDPAREELALPQYELRSGRNGVSGAALAFLVLPADDLARSVTIDWHLDGLPDGAQAVSSLGPGDARSTRPLRSSELGSTYIMVGQPGVFDDDAFFAAWLGDFGFEGRDLMEWAAQLHHYYGAFFDQVPDNFGVFGRTNTLNPGSGIGLTDSFAFTFDDEIARDELKGLLAHEMLHAWVNSLDGMMDAPGGLYSSWFGEGLAVHYQRLLPWRAGLIDDAAFLADLNSTAGRYYTNALIDTPNDEIPGGFWRDTRIRVLPYDRGSLYFAKVDADIRAMSGGARSLDDLVRAMLSERRAGKPMDLALWKRLLRAELGEAGVRQFEAMLDGAVSIPPPDAFGPKFVRVQKPMRRFDLGFDPAVLVSPDRVVRGLKPGSNAARAGLRNGDRITNRFPQDSMQADQQATLTLDILRNGESSQITYLPRGEEVLAYQWESIGKP
ncbi:peptidase M61 [Alteriqipengyuania sp. 357]